MVGALKIRVEDENASERFTRVKKLGGATTTTTTEQTKRAALGDLQNRGIIRAAVAGKEAAQKDLKESKIQYGLRNAKPRVDTHWKKTTLTSVSNAVVGNKNVAAVGGGVTQKPLLRSSSMRLAGTTRTSTNGTLQRHASAQLEVGQPNKVKTLTTKMVESKLQHVKLTKVVKAPEEKKAITAAAATLKREDSSLSRRSLTKLKAALQRNDSTTANITAKAMAKLKASQESALHGEKKTKEPEEDTSKAKVESKFVSTVAPVQARTASLELKIVSVQSHSSQLLSAVEDIDAEDSENLMLVSDYVNDIYDYLFCLEAEQEIRADHLSGQKEVSAKMRAVLVDWINEVHVQFHCMAETYQIAVAIIDCYLQSVKDTKRSHLQLVGVTALFIAAKYEELYPPSVADFVYITDNTYSTKQILQMELKLFKALDCNLSRPLPIQFLRRFSKAANTEDVHHGLAKYFLELTTIEYELTSYKPSEIAAASLFLSLNLLQKDAKLTSGLNDKHWTPTLEFYSRYAATHLRPIAIKIAAIARNAPNAKLKAVYNKYQSSKLHSISLRPELYGAHMDAIIADKE